MRSSLCLCLFAVPAAVASSAGAQLSYGGQPASSWAALARAPEQLELPAPDLAALAREDALAGKNAPLRYGALIALNAGADELGTWETLPDGEKVWRLELRSPGARSLSVVFDDFHLPRGGQLFAYDPQRATVLGAYSDLNNQENGAFGFQPVAGDALVLEYVEPADADFRARLHMQDVIHDYRGVLDILAGKSAGPGDAAGACEIDVNCPQGASWQNHKRAICRQLAGGALCTGALLNNTQNNGTQYYMSAYHCGSLNSAVFYFNYEKPGCNTGSGSLSQTVSGSTQLGGNQTLDFRFVRINQAIPASFNPYFLGWDNTTSAAPSTLCIHHPTGDVKKISFDNNPPTFSGNQWHITQWDLGVTEPGSSGSPLMRNNGRFIGQLYGGASACGFPFDDYYGRFDLAWPSIASFLDPTASGATGIDGFGGGAPPSCGHVTIGAGAGGANIGTLASPGTPTQNTSVTYNISGLGVSGPSTVIISTTQISQSVLGGTIFVDYTNPFSTFPVTLSGGAGSFNVTIPPFPGLTGYFQVGATTAQFQGWVFTNGLAVTICP